MVAQTNPEKPNNREKVLYNQAELIAKVKGEIEAKKESKKIDEAEYEDRMKLLESTIRSEIQENEQVGLTAVELQKFINQENFPPEEAHMFLRERKEINGTAGKEQKSLRETLQEKGEDVVNKTKGFIQNNIDDVKGKIEEFTHMSPFERWAIAGMLGISAGFLGVVGSIGAFFGYNAWKEKAEKMKKMREIIQAVEKDPSEALKKYGTESTKETKEQKDTETGLGEKVAPLAILGSAGVGIFTLIKNKLPKSVANKFDTTDKKGFLGKIASNRALRLFGVGGVTLFSIGQLANYVEKNTHTLGEMPTDENGKKQWWERAMNGAKVGSQDVLDIVTGKKTAEAMKPESFNPEYVALKDHYMTKQAKNEIHILHNKLEGMYHEHPDACKLAIDTLMITKGVAIAGLALKSGSILATLLKTGIFGHPLALSIGLIAGMNGVAALENMQVPRELDKEKIEEVLTDMQDIDEVKEHLGEYCPESITKHIPVIARKLDKNCAELKEDVENIEENVSKQVGKGILDGLILDDAEKICNVDMHGLASLKSDIMGIVLQRNKANIDADNFKYYEALIGTDGKGGILTALIEKTNNNTPLKEDDIHNLMAATTGTDIRIFPEEGSREGQTIQWVHLDNNGMPEGLAKNICVNPLLPSLRKRAIARDFIYDPSKVEIIGTAGGKFLEGFTERLSEAALSIQSNPDRAKTLLQDLIGEKAGGIMGFAGQTYFIDYLGNKYLLGPWNVCKGIVAAIRGDNLEVTEALVEYGQSLAPIFVFGAAGNKLMGRQVGKFRFALETLAYPVKVPKDIGKFIYTKWHEGRLGEIFTQPEIFIRDEFYKNIGRKSPLLSPRMQDIAIKLDHKEHVEKIKHELEIEKRRGGSIINRSKKVIAVIAEAEKILGLGRTGVTNIDDILKPLDAHLKKIDTEINILRGKVRPELLEKIQKNPEMLTHRDIPAKHADMVLARSKTEAKIAELEVEKQKALQKFQSHQMPRTEWEKFRAESARKTATLTNITRELNIRINTPRTVEGKWKGHAKGILGIVALAAIMIGVGKLRADQPGLEIPELDALEGQIDFFGFRTEDDIQSAREGTEKEDQGKQVEAGKDKKIDIASSPEYIRPFIETMQSIKGMYGTEFEFISNPEALQKASKETIQTKVDNLTNIHGQMILDVKEAIKENRDQIKRYCKESGENDFIKLGKGDLNAFFGLKEKNGEISLEYMDVGDFSTTIWEMADLNRDNADEIIAGNYDKWDAGWYVTKRALPGSSEYYDGRDMIRNFGRGKIVNGLKSMGWLAFGMLCDVGMIFSLGTTGLGKIGNATRAGLQWARLGKVLELIKISRTAVESGKLGGQVMGQILSKGITHSGTMMLGNMAADTSHQLIVFPRSKSIGINEL